MASHSSSGFVVRVDRGRVNRRMGGGLTFSALMLVLVLGAAVWVSGLDSGGLAFVPFAIVIAGLTFQIAYLAWIWGLQLGVGVGMVGSPYGISVPVPPYGTVGLAWEAIDRIEARHWHLVIRPVEGLSPESTGVDAAADTRLWRRLHKRGALVPLKLVDTDFAAIAGAIEAMSAGRVAIETRR